MRNFRIINRQTAWLWIGCVGVWIVATLTMHAQGILTLTPGRLVVTGAGTGRAGYSGDGATAASAELASPSAVAYDSNGNLFIADTRNQVVREISKAGVITTVAGTGVAGFGGDGGLATQAYLDSPRGIAVDGNGNLFIADSHNNRIRKVTSGTITTVAGDGIAGFSGDGGPATTAHLALPSGIAVDPMGNFYIADTNNNRIRKVAGATITTIAGNGDEFFAGDNGPATAASLDLPTGVAIDSSGRIYIADRHNERIRAIDNSGKISSVAGDSVVVFANGSPGGGTPVSAALLKPSGVSVDAAGNLYIADTGNERVLQAGNGAVATIAGNGVQGYGGDGSAAINAILNAPKGVATDASGNLAIADTLNERIRNSAQPALLFGSQAVGIASAPQAVSLSNSGNAPLSVSSIELPNGFERVSGGSCSSAPITLAAGESCTLDLVFIPVASGIASGPVVFSGTGIVAQTLLLSGSAVQSSTTTTILTSVTPSLLGQSITFTANVSSAGGGAATGAVTFYDGNQVIGTAQLISGKCSLMMTALVAGMHGMHAVYAGDENFTGSSSSSIPQSVEDFQIQATPSSSNQTVIPGQTATYQFSFQSATNAFDFPVTFSVTGLPTGAKAVFTPQTIAPSSTHGSITLAITTASIGAQLRRSDLSCVGGVVVSMLLLPCLGAKRRKFRSGKLLILCLLTMAGVGTAIGLSGCGTDSGFFGQPQQSYTITVTGTANAAGGAILQHSATVVLTVQ